MPARFLVVPQWQGSGSTRAMRLVDGANAIAGDLPNTSTTFVDVPLEAGDSQGTRVQRLSSISHIRNRVSEALSKLSGPVITIGGDCGVALGSVGAIAARDDVAVVWLDAQPDLNTPESSPSGAFSGMVLRTLLGEGPAALVPTNVVSRDRVVLAGARSLDPGEADYLADYPLTSLAASDFTPEKLIAAIEATGATSVYVHIDLDVLDQGEIEGLLNVEPFGIPSATLIDALRATLEKFEFAGATLSSFAPPSPAAAVEDLPTILRIIGVLASASAR